jgi:hypothetical protein
MEMEHREDLYLQDNTLQIQHLLHIIPIETNLIIKPSLLCPMCHIGFPYTKHVQRERERE